MMHGEYILGVDFSSLQNMAVDVSALEAAAAQLIAQGDEANAIVVATDINAEMDEMVGRLVAKGGFDALVASGTDIENRSYDVVANYDPNVGDASLPGKVAAIQRSMNAWQQQAYGPLSAGSSAAPPTPTPPPVPDAPPPDAPPPSSPPPDGGFGDGGGGDSDPGNIDWGDGEQHADRGGGDDDLVPGGTDQGFDASDGESVSNREDRELNQRSSGRDEFSRLFPSAQDGDEQRDDVEQTDETEDVVGSAYLRGIDVVLGARTKQSSFLVGDDDFFDEIVGEVSIPTAGANYTDKKTVAAVQAALNGRGFGPLKVDGIMGPKTAASIRKMQAAASIPQTGVIDEGVIMTLGVTPGVLPPGVTLQQATAVEVQAALDAATAASRAVTPQDLQVAAAAVVDAAPAQPPELKQEAAKVHAAVLLATTSAQVEAAKVQVQEVAQKVVAAVAPGWWGTPLWSGAPVNRLQGIVGGAGVVALAFGVAMALRR